MLFDFQLGLFFAVLRLAIGVVDDPLGFGFGIFPSQPIQQADEDERHPRRQRRRNDDGNHNIRDPRYTLPANAIHLCRECCGLVPSSNSALAVSACCGRHGAAKGHRPAVRSTRRRRLSAVERLIRSAASCNCEHHQQGSGPAGPAGPPLPRAPPGGRAHKGCSGAACIQPGKLRIPSGCVRNTL